MGDLDEQIEKLKRCELIKESEVKEICAKAREILVEEANVQRVDLPVTVECLIFNFFNMFSLYDLNFFQHTDMWRYSRSIF